MGDTTDLRIGEVSLQDGPTYQRTPFGKEMLKHFLLDPAYTNVNHGSFGTFPRAIREKQREYLDWCEATPDPFIRYEYPKLLDQSREAVSKLLHCPVETVVFIPNATTGVNTVLRNLVWNSDGNDEILYFRYDLPRMAQNYLPGLFRGLSVYELVLMNNRHIYGACLKTVQCVCEASHNTVASREIVVQYPMEDADVLNLFKGTIKASKAAGKTPRIAIFDTVSSLPGLRMPFEELTAVCKQEGVFSLIDGAHGVGHVHLDVSSLDPDFFVSNCHKWLFVPRGCAVFYVPLRNQPLMRSSLPTSHGFVPQGDKKVASPLPPSSKSEFVNQFEFVGTIDNTNYLTVAEAIKWREEVCGGEKAIIEHNTNLTREGGKAVARILGTKTLDNSTGSLTNCCLINILLPLTVSPSKIAGTNTIKPEYELAIIQWMQETIIRDHKSFLPIYSFQGQWWARLSGQVYLELSDFEWAGKVLKEICERAGNEEFMKIGKELDGRGEMVEGFVIGEDGIEATA